MRTEQEVLDIVVPHARLIVANPEKRCARFKISDPDDNRLPCFIGALIPKDVEIGIACDNVYALVEHNPYLKEYLCADIDLLLDLQRTHDSKNMSVWIETLQEIAEENGLNFPE